MFINFLKSIFKSLKLSIAELKSVFSLALSGILLAIRTLLGSFLTFLVTPAVKIGFSTIAIAVTGMIYGPFVSALVGGLGDALSYILNPVGGSYFPGFTINGMVIGLLYGFFFYQKKVTLVRTIICELIINIFAELFLSTLWLVVWFGQPLQVVLIGRLIKSAIMIPINVSLIMLLQKPVYSLRNKYMEKNNK